MWIEPAFGANDTVDQVGIETLTITGRIDEVVYILRSGRHSYSRSSQIFFKLRSGRHGHSRWSQILFKPLNLGRGHVHVATRFAGQVKTGRRIDHFPSFVANGEAVSQDGNVGGESRRRSDHSHHKAEHEFTLYRHLSSAHGSRILSCRRPRRRLYKPQDVLGPAGKMLWVQNTKRSPASRSSPARAPRRCHSGHCAA